MADNTETLIVAGLLISKDNISKDSAEDTVYCGFGQESRLWSGNRECIFTNKKTF